MIKTFYLQNLPHVLSVGAAFFITFRLHNSLPKSVIDDLTFEYENKIKEISLSRSWLDPDAEIYRQQKIFFKKYDSALDKIYGGINYLKNPKVAKIVAEKIHEYDNQLYELICFCIMPNHVHILLDTSIQLEGKELNNLSKENYVQLGRILKLIKGGSAFEVNKLLNRNGRFWQNESYDHYVRGGSEMARIVKYIVMNPVKAKLVNDWEEYVFTYCKKL